MDLIFSTDTFLHFLPHNQAYHIPIEGGAGRAGGFDVA